MNQIQFITHQTDRYSYADGARMALEGGCRWIQLRMKDASDEDFIAVAHEIQPICKRYDAVFILDDRVHLVRQLQADGVHLGKNDMPADEARSLLGEQFIIGGTANTFEDIQRLFRQRVDYIGCGPFRFTTTKAGPLSAKCVSTASRFPSWPSGASRMQISPPSWIQGWTASP